MGFKDSRLGKITSTLVDGFKTFASTLTTVDVDDMSLSDAIKEVNNDGNQASNVSPEESKLITGTVDFNEQEAEFVTNRDETVGPVFSTKADEVKDKKKKSKKGAEVDKEALNKALEDETMKYVNDPANHVDLEKPDPAKLEKGGRDRQRIR